jgi:hypothetical protein
MSATPNGGGLACLSQQRPERRPVLLRPFLNDAGSCASYLFGCTTRRELAVVDPHADLVDGDSHGQARILHASLRRLLELPDHVVLYPSHYGGSVCGRGLSGNPISSIGFERLHNTMLALDDPDAFAEAVVSDMPPRPPDQTRIVSANRHGRTGALA